MYKKNNVIGIAVAWCVLQIISVIEIAYLFDVDLYHGYRFKLSNIEFANIFSLMMVSFIFWCLFIAIISAVLIALLGRDRCLRYIHNFFIK